MKKLVLITDGYPFGSRETFLETEIHYLSKYFDSITIYALTPDSVEHRRLPRNVTVKVLDAKSGLKDKLLSFNVLFTKEFYEEFYNVLFKYKLKLNWKILKTLVSQLIGAYAIMKILESEGEERTIFYSYWANVSAIALAVLKKKHPKFICVTRTHGWDLYFEVHEMKYLPYRSFLGVQLNKIYPISEEGIECIKEQWKISLRNVETSKLGVLRQIKSSLPNIFTLVSCSNLIPLKRIELIIEALSQITEKAIKWVHFGDGVCFEELKEKADNRLSDNINIVWKGRVSNAEVMSFYKNHGANILINVSSSEGVPVSIMEAMSFGIPVIATDVGGTSEVVSNDNGVLLKSTPTVIEIKDAILMVMDENNFEKREEAHNTWGKKYNANTNYIAFTKQLIQLAK